MQLTFIDGLCVCVYISGWTVKLHAVRLSNLIKLAKEEDLFCVRCPRFPGEFPSSVTVKIRLPVSYNSVYSDFSNHPVLARKTQRWVYLGLFLEMCP